MALATPADVRRYLPGVTVDDGDLTPFIEAVEEWLKDWANADWDATGTVIESFYNTREGSVLKLKERTPTSVVVSTYLSMGSSASVLTLNSGYAIMTGGKIQLRILASPRLQGLRPEELDAYASGALVYAKIEVSYTASGVVPYPVREGVALTVAARYVQNKAVVAGVKSERLGDYSYVREDKDEDKPAGVPEEALTMFEPYRRYRHAVSV